MAANGPAHAASDADVLRDFGMLGTSAVDCGHPPTPANPYMVFADVGGSVHRVLRTGVQQLDGTFRVRAISRLDDTHAAMEIEDATGKFAKVVIVRQGNVWHTDRSDEPDGRPLIRDGRIVTRDVPVPRFARCPGP
jgi:hypothetical protein